MSKNIEAAFKQLSHGVYVMGVTDGIYQNAFTAAWVMQASFSPLLLAISINPEHYSYQLLKVGGVCSVNVLGDDQSAVADHFGRAGKDKMTGFQWHVDCEVSHYSDAGDHKIAICKVISAARLNQGHPLLYSQTGDMDGSSELYK